MALTLPPIPQAPISEHPSWRNWFQLLSKNFSTSTTTSQGTPVLTPDQVLDLTDGGDSTLHFHSSDRNRANHFGTQTASTISDFNQAALIATATYNVLTWISL